MNQQIDITADAKRQTERVTILGVVVNLILAALKTMAGLLTGSLALVADGIHSLSDMATDVAVLIGSKIASKGPDSEHPYGHSWAQTAAAGFIAFVLIAVGGAMIYKAARDITDLKETQMTVTVAIISLISIAAKEVVYYLTARLAKKLHCPMLHANAWHHRTDSLSSLAVLLGYFAFRMGFAYADQLAAVVVGLLILLVALRVLIDCASVFTERSVDNETAKQITEIITGETQIISSHGLRTRTVGRQLFMDLHILVDPQINITRAHEISESLEEKIHNQLSRPVNITVHIEPDLPELRTER